MTYFSGSAGPAELPEFLCGPAPAPSRRDDWAHSQAVATKKCWSGCPASRQKNGTLETGRAGSGGTHFGGVDAEAQTREIRLAQGHRAGVQVAPDKEQQEWHGG